MGAANYAQTDWLWRNDDGSLAYPSGGASNKESLNTYSTTITDLTTKLRVRCAVDETGMTSSWNPKLRIQKNGAGGFVQATTADVATANGLFVTTSNNTSWTICPECKKRKPAHQVCKSCGTYKGTQVLKVK